MDKAKVHIEADDGDVLPAASKVPQDSQDPTADVGEDGVGIATAAVDDSSCSSTAAVSRQKISDKEVRLAGEAKRHYLEGRFAEALDPMLALARMRPEDPLVVANAAAVQFQACRISMEEAYSALQQLYLAIVKGSGGELDDTEMGVLLYNLAVLAFLKKDFLTAEKLVRRVYLAVTQAGQHHHQQQQQQQQHAEPEWEGSFRKKVLLLLVATFLARRMPGPALAYLNGEASVVPAAATAGSPGCVDTARATLARALAYVQSRQYKALKRDTKQALLRGHDLTTYEFLRANLEYAKGNHRKALKLLSLAMQQHQSDRQAAAAADGEAEVDGVGDGDEDSVAAASTYTTSLYTNNLGCLHVVMNKPNLGIFYLDRALAQHAQCLAAEVAGPRTTTTTTTTTTTKHRNDRALRIKKCEITYNLGLALLQAGRPVPAFNALLKTVPELGPSRPNLWLHLAECCIAHHARRQGRTAGSASARLAGCLYGGTANSSTKGSAAGASGNGNPEPFLQAPRLSLVAVGHGPGRKVILRPDWTDLPAAYPEGNMGELPHQAVHMSLQFAQNCLCDALFVLDQGQGDLYPDAAGLPASSGSASGEEAAATSGSSGSSPNKSAASPAAGAASKYPSTYLVRAAVLANRAFVELCLDNPIVALESAQQLLGLEIATTVGPEAPSPPPLPSGYRMLGHLYAAEALVMLDRISEAIAQLDTVALGRGDLSFNEVADETTPVVEPPSTNGKRKGQQPAPHPGATADPSGMSCVAARLLFKFNLAVAFVLRGEVEKADELTEKLWHYNCKGGGGGGQQGPGPGQGRAPPGTVSDRLGIGAQLIVLRLYIALLRGHVAKSREIVKNHCIVVQHVAAASAAATEGPAPAMRF